MINKKKSLFEEIEEKENIKNILLPIVYDYKARREKSVGSVDMENELKDKLRKIKEDSINNIKELKKKAIESLERNGMKVIEAKDADAAAKEIRKIIGSEKLIVKSKSNTANEIELKEILKDKELVETDTGDFVVELTGAEDLHPVLPSMHLTPANISKAIKEKLHKDVKANPEEIVKFVRGYLREKIENAKVGITGANVISADGTVFILENEGNISLVSRIPDKHIILASFEKIVPTREDALHIVKCAANYGTGQEYPMYVSMISGPSKTADIQNKMITGAQGAKEVYLILLDNGRSEILESEFKELLYCINCGACLNFCPVFHQLTMRYGSKHFGGARGVLGSFFEERDGAKEAFDNGAFYCTTCKMCKENCPARIDLSEMIKKLREKLADKGLQPKGVEEMMKNVREYGNPFGNVKDGEMPDKLYCC